MTVEKFDPIQTTTLDAPKSVLAEAAASTQTGNAQSRIGFVSLGCPKNLVDSERIITQLRTEGYDVVPTYNDADLVIVKHLWFH